MRDRMGTRVSAAVATVLGDDGHVCKQQQVHLAKRHSKRHSKRHDQHWQVSESTQNKRGGICLIETTSDLNWNIKQSTFIFILRGCARVMNRKNLSWQKSKKPIQEASMFEMRADSTLSNNFSNYRRSRREQQQQKAIKAPGPIRVGTYITDPSQE